VVRYSLACGRFLASRGVKVLLIACNTASAHALPALRAAFDLPVLGAVEPGARTAHAATGSGHIGVIGTLGTIRSGAYAKALTALDGKAVVTGQACPLLVPLAEEGWTDDDVAFAIARRYLTDLAAADASIDTLVLGCTHYPLLVPVLRRAAAAAFGRAVTLVDSATAMAGAVRDTLAGRDELRMTEPDRPARRAARQRPLGSGNGRGSLRCYVTDASRLDELAPRFLGEPLADFDTVDLGI
jgi:glutamate racemase